MTVWMVYTMFVSNSANMFVSKWYGKSAAYVGYPVHYVYKTEQSAL
jgi:hypothetical protein